ncbi:MAG TPA: hypothetical protein VG894_01040 [Bauldia sp.]|nr:hypothetical protein [Bauldia sp.]
MVLNAEGVNGAIYVPPKSGLPFLVVTFAEGGMRTEMAGSRAEARALLAQRTRRARPAEARPAIAGSDR